MVVIMMLVPPIPILLLLFSIATRPVHVLAVILYFPLPVIPIFSRSPAVVIVIVRIIDRAVSVF